MEVMLLLIPLSVVLVLAIGALFWWSVGSGQFDDLEGPAHRILADDDAPEDRHIPEIGALTAIKPEKTGNR